MAKDPYDFTCTVCSAHPGQPCRDRTFVECEPHQGRLALAGLLWE